MEIALPVLIGIVALAAVLYPLLRRGDGPHREAPLGEQALDAEVLRYREAMQAGTVCERCLQANPPESRFCAECGAPLAAPTPAERAE